MSHKKLLQQKITQEDITDILLKNNQFISKDDLKKLNSFTEDLKDKKKLKEQELKELDQELPENSKKIKSIMDSIQNKNNQIEKIKTKIEFYKNAKTNIKQNIDTKSNKNSDSKKNTIKQNTLKQFELRKDVVYRKPIIENENIKHDPVLDQIKKRLDGLCFTRNSFTRDKKLVTTGKGESWAVFFMNPVINALVKEYEEKLGLKIVGSDVVEGEEDMFLLHRSKDNKKFAMYVELKGNKVVPFNDIWEASALLEDLLKS